MQKDKMYIYLKMQMEHMSMCLKLEELVEQEFLVVFGYNVRNFWNKTSNWWAVLQVALDGFLQVDILVQEELELLFLVVQEEEVLV